MEALPNIAGFPPVKRITVFLSEPFTLGMATAGAIIVADVAMIVSAETKMRATIRRRASE
ncbi:MAG: hypothetical protein ACRDJF_06835 [Actinomycetota bacterium]